MGQVAFHGAFNDDLVGGLSYITIISHDNSINYNNILSIFLLIDNLVGGLEYVLFSIIYGIKLPIDVYIFQDG